MTHAFLATTPSRPSEPLDAILHLDADPAWLKDWVNTQLQALFPTLDIPPVRDVCIQQLTLARDRNAAGLYLGLASRITLNSSCFLPLQGKPKALHDAMESVLLHELCHHVQRTLHGDAVPTHGREFRELMWHINGTLEREVVTVSHSLQIKAEGQDNERLHRRALALLARSASANEHEAALAAAKYTELSLAHDLQLDPVSGELARALPPMDDWVVHVSGRADSWRVEILKAVALIHACKLYWNGKGPLHFHLVGRPHKIDQAYDLIDYLIEAVERAVKAERKLAKTQPTLEITKHQLQPYYACDLRTRSVFRMGNAIFPITTTVERKGRSYYGAFRDGIAEAIAQRLYADHDRRLAEGLTHSNGISHVPGLVIRDHFKKERDALENYLADCKYGFRHTSRNGYSNDGGHSSGRSAGASISLNKQCSSSAPRALKGTS